MFFAKSLLAAAAMTTALMAVPIAAQAHDTNEAPENLQVHDLKDFDKIEVSGVYHIDVKIGETFSVTTSGADKEVKFMDVRQEGDTLVLGTKEKKKNWNMGDRQEVFAEITLPSLTSLDVAGIAVGDVTGLVDAELDLDIAGITELTLSGSCQSMTLDMAGIGEVNAQDLTCRDVTVDLAGMGEANVYASESVDADAAGMGQITVYGSPKSVKKDSNFMASVKIK
ncbi:head GIN domain-containing protein [Litorimonas sp. RW-G-Af-16]|uniref:head GIN domain-containing protein n=1 Tax=Litorimonas sp. RW-G-Af-16 TaxID=3241168 RepID=UPI00390CB30B